MIWYEAPYIGKMINASTVLILYGLEAFTLRAAWQRDIAIRKVPTHIVTKFTLGSAHPRREEKKRLTIDLCRRHGWKVEDDNEADAIALFLYASHETDPVATANLWGPLATAHQP